MRLFCLFLSSVLALALTTHSVQAQTPPPPAPTPTVDFATVGDEEGEHDEEAEGLANPIPDAPTARPEARTTSVPTPVVLTPYETQVRLQGAMLVVGLGLVVAVGVGLWFWAKRRPKA